MATPLSLFSFTFWKKSQRCATNWLSQHISAAGRQVLTTSVLNAIPSFHFQLFYIPISAINNLDRVRRNFTWGHSYDSRKMHHANWDIIKLSKQDGGWGLKDLHFINMAFLGKQAWRLHHHNTSLAARVIQAKYHKTSSLLQAKPQSGQSWGFNSLLRGRDAMRKGMFWKVNNGQNINFWSDHWVTDQPLLNQVSPNPQDIDVSLTVADFILQQAWDIPKLQGILPHQIVSLIASLPLPTNPHIPDQFIWPHSKSGQVTVNTLYSYLEQQQNHLPRQHSPQQYKLIWSYPAPPKLLFFLWSLVTNTLPVRSNLHKKSAVFSSSCPLCGFSEETTRHLFQQCPVSSIILSSAQRQIQINWPNTTPSLQWLQVLLQANKGKFLQLSTALHLLWQIWKARNNKVFNSAAPFPPLIISTAIFKAAQHINSRVTKTVREPQIIYLSWSPPPTGFYKINTDGSLQNHKAGIGFILRNDLGLFVAGISRCIGTHSISTAELWAIKDALGLAR